MDHRRFEILLTQRGRYTRVAQDTFLSQLVSYAFLQVFQSRDPCHVKKMISVHGYDNPGDLIDMFDKVNYMKPGTSCPNLRPADIRLYAKHR